MDDVSHDVFANAAPYRTIELDYDARRDPKTSHYCVKCQRDLKPTEKYRMVHLVDGGAFVLHPNDEAIYATMRDPRSDAGNFAIGSDCARRLGLEWTTGPFDPVLKIPDQHELSR